MSIQHVAAVLDARDERLTGCRKLVLIALANRSDQFGKCWPSQELLAGECGINTRTLRDHLTALETDGFIVRETTQFGKGKGSRTVYQLIISSLRVAPEEIAAASVAPEDSVSCTGSPPPLKSNLQEPTLDDDDSACARNALKVKCRQWANGALVPEATGFLKIEILADQTGDLRCTEDDIEAGILKASSWLRSNGKRAKSFGYFVKAVIAERDARLSPTPVPGFKPRADALDKALSAAPGDPPKRTSSFVLWEAQRERDPVKAKALYEEAERMKGMN